MVDTQHGRPEGARDLDACRPQQHHQQGREDAENEREQQFQADLRRAFLGQDAALGAQVIGMHPQRIAHAGAEALGLDQHRHQGIDVVDADP